MYCWYTWFFNTLTVSPSWLAVKREVISLVHPITNRLKMTTMLPRIRNGRRRPKREVHRSDKTPTIGCINNPIWHFPVRNTWYSKEHPSTYLIMVLQSIQATWPTWSIQVTTNKVFLHRCHGYTSQFIASSSFFVLPYAISTVPLNQILLSFIHHPHCTINKETYM